MNSQVGSILKILILSAGLSFLVKYGGRLLPIPATSISSLILINLPWVLVSLALWLRSSKVSNSNSND